MRSAADCSYQRGRVVEALLAAVLSLLAPGGVLLLASRTQRFGLAELLGSLRCEPGLRLVRVVVFDEDGTGGGWQPASDPMDKAIQPLEASEAAEADVPARHYLWQFERHAREGGRMQGHMHDGAREGAAVAPAVEPSADTASTYHEQQSLLHCGRHSLNNLLGRAAFSSADLDEIALSIGQMQGYALPRLSLSHRWPLVGNFDVRPPTAAAT